VSDFYRSKKSLRRKGLLAPAAAKNTAPLFQQAHVMARAAGRCRLLHPSGLSLEFDVGADPLWLGQLLRALP
jgi:hypothetical protein